MVLCKDTSIILLYQMEPIFYVDLFGTVVLCAWERFIFSYSHFQIFAFITLDWWVNRPFVWCHVHLQISFEKRSAFDLHYLWRTLEERRLPHTPTIVLSWNMTSVVRRKLKVTWRTSKCFAYSEFVINMKQKIGNKALIFRRNFLFRALGHLQSS